MKLRNITKYIFSIEKTTDKGYKRKNITILGIKFKLKKRLAKPNKIKLLYCPSDNYALSGAFLSMVTLCKLLKENFNVEPIIILPKKGSGTDLLKKAKLKYKIIESEDWILPIGSSFSEIIHKIRISLKNIRAVYKIIKVIYKENIDIIHINTVWGYVGGIAAILTRKPLVWHIRECIKEGQGKNIFIGDLGYNLINKSNAIILISNAVQSKYPRLNRSKIKIIYNGINEKVFYNPNHKIFEDNEIKFACVGNIQKLKGQQNLVDACKMLIDNNIKNWELDIIGRGQNAQGIQDLIDEYNLNDYIHLLGHKSDIQNYLADCDISFVPSHFEAFGRVTVEAMLSGCLVIAANAGGTPEIIRDKENGLLHEVDNPDSIYQTILWAINNREKCCEIAHNARNSALNDYTALQNATNIYNLYNTILLKENKTNAKS